MYLLATSIVSGNGINSSRAINAPGEFVGTHLISLISYSNFVKIKILKSDFTWFYPLY